MILRLYMRKRFTPTVEVFIWLFGPPSKFITTFSCSTRGLHRCRPAQRHLAMKRLTSAQILGLIDSYKLHHVLTPIYIWCRSVRGGGKILWDHLATSRNEKSNILIQHLSMCFLSLH
jgi:hypothetical protein